MANPDQNAETRAAAARIRRNWLLSAPALLLVALFATLPLCIMVVCSFLTSGQNGNLEWQFSTDGWVSVILTRDMVDGTTGFADAHLTIIWRSVKLSVLTTLITLAVGFPTAWFIATRPARTRAFWLFLVIIPFAANLLIRTFAIHEIIRNEGLINTVLLALGLISKPFQMIHTDGAVLLGMAYVYLPLMVLPLYAAMDRFDMRMLDAAHDLYATRLQVLRRIVVPIVRPGVVAGCILVFIPALGAYVTPLVLGGGQHMMLGNFIESQFVQGRNWPLGAAFSVALFAIAMLAMLALARATNREAGK